MGHPYLVYFHELVVDSEMVDLILVGEIPVDKRRGLPHDA